MIGRWLAKQAAGKRPRISTKFNIDTSAGDFAGQIERSVAASLQRLGLARVELLILHSRVVGNSPDGDNRSMRVAEVIGPGGVADIMDGLRRKGVCDWIGLTGLGEPAALQQVIDSGRFDAAQIYYNLLNPTAADKGAGAGWNTTDFDGLLHRCAAQDMGVMGIRIFAAGHLATTERHGGRWRSPPMPRTPQRKPAPQQRSQVLASETGTPAQKALRFGLANPLLSTIVVGIGETWHLDEALAAAEMGPLSASAVARLETLWRGHPAFRS